MIKVGLYDTLRNVACGYDSATAITRSWQRLGVLRSACLISLKITTNNVSLRISLQVTRAKVFLLWSYLPAWIRIRWWSIRAGLENWVWIPRALAAATDVLPFWLLECWHYTALAEWWEIWRQMLTEEQKQLCRLPESAHFMQWRTGYSSRSLFDLMYANENGWRFNEHSNTLSYANMRRTAFYNNSISTINR